MEGLKRKGWIMTKKIGITCDNYKADFFRKGLLKDGFKLEYDGSSGVHQVHLFRIEVEESGYTEMTKKISKTVKRLEIEFKQSN